MTYFSIKDYLHTVMVLDKNGTSLSFKMNGDYKWSCEYSQDDFTKFSFISRYDETDNILDHLESKFPNDARIFVFTESLELEGRILETWVSDNKGRHRLLLASEKCCFQKPEETISEYHLMSLMPGKEEALEEAEDSDISSRFWLGYELKEYELDMKSYLELKVSKRIKQDKLPEYAEGVFYLENPLDEKTEAEMIIFNNYWNDPKFKEIMLSQYHLYFYEMDVFANLYKKIA